MKILKPGKEIHKKRKFTCRHCGCEFVADKKEYQIDWLYNERQYSMRCPNCFESVSDSEEVEE